LKLRLSISLPTLLLISGSALMVAAQTPGPSLEDRLSKIETAANGAQTAGDNAWVLVSTALVLLMTGPGLALFYGGLVRKKNVLGTMMQSFMLMAVVSVLWAIYGYSLAFASVGSDMSFCTVSALNPTRTTRPLSRRKPTCSFN
jgi:ammonium transporter, Amt family